MRNRDAHHLTRIRRTYGLTPAQYYELLEHQGYRCALCGVHERELPERLCIDHCHDTGIVRGALCRSCNASVGSAEKHGTAAHAGYLAWPPTKELAHRKAHPDGPHPA